jgi:hypothetical protein
MNATVPLEPTSGLGDGVAIVVYAVLGAAGRLHSAQNGRSGFPKAASQPNRGSVSWNALKLPLATSPCRPTAAARISSPNLPHNVRSFSITVVQSASPTFFD